MARRVGTVFIMLGLGFAVIRTAHRTELAVMDGLGPTKGRLELHVIVGIVKKPN